MSSKKVKVVKLGPKEGKTRVEGNTLYLSYSKARQFDAAVAHGANADALASSYMQEELQRQQSRQEYLEFRSTLRIGILEERDKKTKQPTGVMRPFVTIDGLGTSRGAVASPAGVRELCKPENIKALLAAADEAEKYSRE